MQILLIFKCEQKYPHFEGYFGNQTNSAAAQEILGLGFLEGFTLQACWVTRNPRLQSKKVPNNSPTLREITTLNL
jgi:hypothetical protein